MCTTADEVFRLRNMFCKIKYTVCKIKILIVNTSRKLLKIEIDLFCSVFFHMKPRLCLKYSVNGCCY